MPVWAPFCAREDDRGTAPKVRQARARLAAAQRVSGVMKVCRGRTPLSLSWKVWNIRYRYSTKAVVRIVGCGLAAWRGHSRDHRTRTSNELCATVWELDDDLTPSPGPQKVSACLPVSVRRTPGTVRTCPLFARSCVHHPSSRHASRPAAIDTELRDRSAPDVCPFFLRHQDEA